METNKKIAKTLKKPRIRAILNCYIQEGKSKLESKDILNKLSRHPRNPYSGKIERDPIIKDKSQLRRDMISLEDIGVVKRVAWGEYELDSKYYKYLLRNGITNELESYPIDMVLFEGKSIYFGLLREEITDDLKEDYGAITNELERLSDKLEILWMRIRLSQISYLLEKALSRKTKIEKKARLYKNINNHITINLSNRSMNTEYHETLLKPFLDRIKHPEVKNIDEIIEYSKNIEDEFKNLKDQDGKSILNEISNEMWKKQLDSSTSAFDTLIEEKKINLPPENVNKIRRKLKKKEKMSNEFRNSLYYLGLDAPTAVINPRFQYYETDLVPFPIIQD